MSKPTRSWITLALLVAQIGLAGLHLPLLQGVAWTSMLVQFSQNNSLEDAVRKTFDGENPCSLCEIVQTELRASPDAMDIVQHTRDPLNLPPNTLYLPPLRYPLGVKPIVFLSANSFQDPPPVPPPRA